MKIELNHIKVRDLVEAYTDDGEQGVVGYGGKLDIRPPYQREYVYNPKQRDAVMDTLTKYFPLNVMYWVRTGEDTYEVLDGQQRTLSICKYVNSEYSIDYRFFHNLTAGEQKHILEYPLTVYICEGTESEKLEWFKTVNIAGVKLTDQELRNAVYAGPFVSDAKRYFSKTDGAGYNTADGLMKGTPNRQDYLEQALKWIVDRDELKEIEDYMSIHQNNPNANDLWLYFRNVIDWARTLFPDDRKEKTNVEWGYLYNKYKDNPYDAGELEERVKVLMIDDDVTKKSGIYPYLFDRKEKHLNIRAFTANMKRSAYERQGGICPMCQGKFTIKQMEADHITPWHAGGKTNAENCQMLCKEDNRRKSGV